MRKIALLALLVLSSIGFAAPARGALYPQMAALMYPAVADAPTTVVVVVGKPSPTDPDPTGTMTITWLGNVMGSDSVKWCPNFEEFCAGVSVPEGFVAGDIEVNASYSGDANYGAISTGPMQVHIQRRETRGSLSADVASAAVGSPVTFTFTLAKVDKYQVANASLGYVELWDRTTGLYIGNATVNPDWKATFVLKELKPGPHSFEAVYRGTTDWLPSAAGMVNVTITGSTAASTLKATPAPTTSAAPTSTTAAAVSTTTTASNADSTGRSALRTQAASNEGGGVPVAKLIAGLMLLLVASAVVGSRVAKRR